MKTKKLISSINNSRKLLKPVNESHNISLIIESILLEASEDEVIKVDKIGLQIYQAIKNKLSGKSISMLFVKSNKRELGDKFGDEFKNGYVVITSSDAGLLVDFGLGPKYSKTADDEIANAVRKGVEFGKTIDIQFNKPKVKSTKDNQNNNWTKKVVTLELISTTKSDTGTISRKDFISKAMNKMSPDQQNQFILKLLPPGSELLKLRVSGGMLAFVDDPESLDNDTFKIIASLPILDPIDEEEIGKKYKIELNNTKYTFVAVSSKFRKNVNTKTAIPIPGKAQGIEIPDVLPIKKAQLLLPAHVPDSNDAPKIDPNKVFGSQSNGLQLPAPKSPESPTKDSDDKAVEPDNIIQPRVIPKKPSERTYQDTIAIKNGVKPGEEYTPGDGKKSSSSSLGSKIKSFANRFANKFKRDN